MAARQELAGRDIEKEAAAGAEQQGQSEGRDVDQPRECDAFGSHAWRRHMRSELPCIDVCRFERRTGWCVGCGRTASEVRAWRKMRPYARQALSGDLKRRLDRLRADASIEAIQASAGPSGGKRPSDV